MTRKTAHTQAKEPFLEYLLSWLRFKKAEKHITKGSKVADLGSGYNGNFLKRVAPIIKLGIGYDIATTKNKISENIVLKKADLNKTIDSKRNYYDSITALAVLEHVENPEKFVSKAKSMLKSGGKLIITTPHRRLKPFLEILSSLRIISKDEIKDHKTYFTNKTLRSLLKSQGLRIVSLETFELGLNLFAIAQKTT